MPVHRFEKLTPKFLYMILLVNEIFNDLDKTAAWFNTENLNFGGFSPLWLINRGREQKVYDFILSHAKKDPNIEAARTEEKGEMK